MLVVEPTNSTIATEISLLRLKSGLANWQPKYSGNRTE